MGTALLAAVSHASAQVPGWTLRMLDIVSPLIDNQTKADTFLDNTATSGLDIQADVTVLSDVVDIAGGGGNYPVNNPYPDGVSGTAKDDVTVRATADVTIPAGRWSIAFGSDDGGQITVAGVDFSTGADGTESRFGENGDRVSNDSVRFEGTRGHSWTGGTFVLDAPLTTTVVATFFERGGGDSFEVAVRDASGGINNSPQDGPGAGWELLGDGVFGWSLTTNGQPAKHVAGWGVIGDEALAVNRENEEFGDAPYTPGLTQEWWQNGNPGSKAGIDAVIAARGPDNGPFKGTDDGGSGTWWTGNGGAIPGIQGYPPVTTLGRDNYFTRLTGEILIPESGDYKFKDGVDDYTYLAIDLNRSGVAGDDPSEVLIDDNTWTGVETNQNGGSPIVTANVTVAEGGEWLPIEMNTAEGGGGDAGILYWDYDPSAPEGSRLGAGVGFPTAVDQAVDLAANGAALLVPDTHLRSKILPLERVDLVGVVPNSSGSMAPAGGSWSADGGVGVVSSNLASPTITVPSDGMVTVSFDHRYNFEDDGTTRWDGGALFISVNGDPATIVDAAEYTQNGPPTDRPITGNSPPLSGEFAFNNTSPGFAQRQFITSVANLGMFSAGDTIQLQFIGAWDEGFIQTPAPNWEIKSVSLDNGANLLAVNFDESNGGFSVTNVGGVAGPWVYNPFSGLPLEMEINVVENPAPSAWRADGGEGVVSSNLKSPTITVPADGALTVSFDHRYNFEDDGTTRWDGGALFISVNGDPATIVDAAEYTQNGPPTDRPITGNSPPLSGEFAFNNTSPGFAEGQHITSVANLGTFTAGDVIQLQFIGAWDEGFIQTPAPNWEIARVSVANGSEIFAADFAQGSSGFRVENTGNVAGPWTFDVNPTHESDRFVLAASDAPMTTVLSEDFDGGGVNSTYAFTNTSGSPASDADGVATITNLDGSNNNSIAWDAVTIGATRNLRLEFDYATSNDDSNAAAGGCCGEAADGFGIGFFATAAHGETGPNNPGTGGAWEDPRGGGFDNAVSLHFDIFDGGGPNGNNILVNVLGTLVADISAPFMLNDESIHRVTMDLIDNGDGSATLALAVTEDVNGAAIHHTLISGAVVSDIDLPAGIADGFRLIAGGRTGGAFAQTDLDNVHISVSDLAQRKFIDLNNAAINVSIAPGSVLPEAGDTFDLFEGGVIRGQLRSLTLPPGQWDTSGLQPGGSGSITMTSTDVSGWLVRALDVQGGVDGSEFIDNHPEAEDFLDNTGTANILVQDDRTVVREVIDIAGGAGNYPVNDPYPDGVNDASKDDVTVRAITNVTIPAGRWTVAFGSDDGGQITVPGVDFSTGADGAESRFNENGPQVGIDSVRYDGNRGHQWTGGTFVLDAPLDTMIIASFHERGGGDSFEVAFRDASADINNDPTTGPDNGWNLLENGLNGWRVTIGRDMAVPGIHVAGLNRIGVQSVGGGTIENEVFGDPETEPGLLQEWWQNGNPGSKAGLDALFASRLPDNGPFRGTDDGGSGTWWTGNGGTIPGIQAYPPVTTLGRDNYATRLTGEILIPESGDYRFKDGVDDFTYLAIDLDKSGVAGDAANEVLVDDNTWTGVETNQNGGSPIATATVTVADGGEWLAMEMNTAEGGGGDAGVLYWDYDPTAQPGSRLGAGVGFPTAQDVAIDLAANGAALLVPDTHLRSTYAPLASADLVIKLDPSIPLEFEVDSSGAGDQLVVGNPDPEIYRSVVDLSGVDIVVMGLGAIPSGTTLDLFGGATIRGQYNSVSLPEGEWDISGLAPGGNGTIIFDPDAVLPPFAIIDIQYNPGDVMEVYSQDFDFPDGTTDFGDGSTLANNSFGNAQVVGNRLRLTEAGMGSQRASFRIPALAGSSTGWVATFDLELVGPGGGAAPADGFNFSYGAIPPYDPAAGEADPAGHGAAEEGWPGVSHISFEVDSYLNFDAEQGLNIAVDTVDVAFNNGPIIDNDGNPATGTATIAWFPDAGATFTTTGLLTNADFSRVATPGFTADDALIWAFGARTGGATESVFIDNLMIVTGGPTISITWNSRPAHQYDVEASPDGETWVVLATGVPSQGETTTFIDRPSEATKTLLYRVRDLGQP